LPHGSGAKVGEGFVRRQVAQQFRVNIQGTDCDLKVSSFAQKIRPIFSAGEQVSDRRQRGGWQPKCDYAPVHFSASHTRIVSITARFSQKPTSYPITPMRY
jgi:hypothetical protein